MKIVDINSAVEAGKKRIEDKKVVYNATINGIEYLSEGTHYLGALEYATYYGKIANVVTNNVSEKELEALGLKKDAKVYCQLDSMYYIQLGDEDEAICFRRK